MDVFLCQGGTYTLAGQKNIFLYFDNRDCAYFYDPLDLSCYGTSREVSISNNKSNFQ